MREKENSLTSIETDCKNIFSVDTEFFLRFVFISVLATLFFFVPKNTYLRAPQHKTIPSIWFISFQFSYKTILRIIKTFVAKDRCRANCSSGICVITVEKPTPDPATFRFVVKVTCVDVGGWIRVRTHERARARHTEREIWWTERKKKNQIYLLSFSIKM